jgi:hypothetical protein
MWRGTNLFINLQQNISQILVINPRWKDMLSASKDGSTSAPDFEHPSESSAWKQGEEWKQFESRSKQMKTLYQNPLDSYFDIAGISFYSSSMLDNLAELSTKMVAFIMKLCTSSESRHMIHDNLPSNHMLS